MQHTLDTPGSIHRNQVKIYLSYKLLSPLGAKPEDDNITRSASARMRLSIILHWTSEPDIAEEVGIF